MISRLGKLWAAVRELTGDDAYERYVSHWRQHHAADGAVPLDRAAFCREEQRRNLLDLKVCDPACDFRVIVNAGDAKPLEETIAKGAGCTEGYVRHIVELAFLAPDIARGILLGMQPRHLTVDRLVRQEIPISWAQQRALFGFRA